LPGPTQSTSSVDPPSHESTRIVRPRVAPRGSCLPRNESSLCQGVNFRAERRAG
jgi:hypothetical protein